MMTDLDFWDFEEMGEPGPTSHKAASPDAPPVVQWMPIACPRCGSREKKTTGHYADKALRYHRCAACRLKFQSLELEATPDIQPSDRGHWPPDKTP